MSNVIKIKRGSGSDPSASDMVLGEPVLRTDTAELFFKKDDGSVAKVSGGGGGPDFKYLELRNAANNGAASYPANDFTLVSAGTTTAVSPAAAATLLVSVSGVIQKPNSGTSTSGITGFIVDGSRFKTATNLPAAPDFIIYQESGGIGEPSDDTVSTDKIIDEAVTVAKIQHISQNTILGRTASGSGDVETLNASDVRGMINVENGATGDQTAAEIRTLVESASDSNVFTDADHTKLNGIEANATADQSNSEIKTAYEANSNTNALTDALLSKLNGIEASATADQSNSEIKTAYEANSNTNAFTDALLSKLNGIAASATNVTNNNQLTNGAGYITATLTNEQVQDIVGGMVSGNSESGITVTYQDSDGTLDFSVASQTDNNFTTTLKNKLDGIAAGATNVTNTNQLTNGAGFITSADGGNAATLDSLDSTSFVRSDADDTMFAKLTISRSSHEKLVLSGSADPYILFQEGTTNKAYIQWDSDGYVAIANTESSESLRVGSGSSGLKFVEGGNVRNVYHTGNLGVGDGFLSENNFTDALKSKLDGISSGATVGLPTSGGTLTGTLNARAIVPTANNTYDLGTSSNRWRNLYTNDLNLSNEGGANDVDGTYGSFTIQEGEEDLFLINRRNGKKYKFNLTEVI